MKMSSILETCQLKTFLLSLMAGDFLPLLFVFFYVALFFRDFECIFDLSGSLSAFFMLLFSHLSENPG